MIMADAPKYKDKLVVTRKVAVITDKYEPYLGKGAVGRIQVAHPAGNDYVVAFSGKRMYRFTSEQIRPATKAEIARDKSDPDLDEAMS
jgi:hypothetical protein